MDKISLVVPCLNEEATIPIFYRSVRDIMAQMPEQNFEIIFVNDGSTDQTLPLIKHLSEQDRAVKYISFSRNFGKESAIYAGLMHAAGDYVTIMDADLQDPPALLPEMYQTLIEGDYDCVATRRTSRRGEPRIRSFFAKMFYRIIHRLSKIDIVDGARDFRMMNRRMVDSILSISEYNRFSKGIFAWVGFKIKWLPYQYVERAAGKTKWSFHKLFLYSLEGIIAYSTAPLMISSLIGLFMFGIAILMLIAIFIRTIFWGDPVDGWPSLASIILFVGGIQLFCTGILGQYLSKTYLETKKRPIYIVRESNLDEMNQRKIDG